MHQQCKGILQTHLMMYCHIIYCV